MSEIAVNFQAHGVAHVLKAFETIEKKASQFGASVLRSEKSVTQLVIRETAKQQDAHVRATQAHERATAKANAKIEREAKKVADQKIRQTERTAKEIEKSLQRETAAFQRESDRQRRIASQSQSRRIQEAETASRKIAAHETAAMRAGEQSRRSAARSIAGSVTSRAGQVLGGLGRVAGGIMAVGGGFSAVDAVQTGISNRGMAADIAIASNGEINKTDAYNRAASAATAYGTSTASALGAVDRFYAKSGNAKQAMDIMPSLLALATATGGDASEIAEAGGQVANADKTLTADQVAKVMRGWAGQGRAGSVDMRELASGGARIAAGAALFSGDRAENMVKLGGIVQQSTAGGAASAAEATESVARLASDAFKHKDALKKMGVDATDQYGRLIGPEELIKKSVIATKGDRAKLQDAYGEMSIKAVGGYANVYNDARIRSRTLGASEKDSEKAGEAALDAAFKTWADAALTEKQVKEDAAKRLAEVDKRIEAAMNQLREAVADKLLPKLIELLPQLTALIPKFAELLSALVAMAEWMGKNPFKAIILAISAAVIKDVAMAGIGKAIASLIASGGGGVGGAAGSAATGAAAAAKGGGAARNLAAGGVIASIAVATASAGMAGIDHVFASKDKERASILSADLDAAGMAASARRMPSRTPEELEKKRAATEAAMSATKDVIRRKREDASEAGLLDVRGGFKDNANWIGSDASGVEADAQKRSIDQSVKELERLSETVSRLNSMFKVAGEQKNWVELDAPQAGKPMSSPDRG